MWLLIIIVIIETVFIYNQYDIYSKNNETCKSNIKKLTINAEELKNDNEKLLKTNSELLYYKEAITFLEKDEIENVYLKLENVKKSSLLSLFNSNWTLIDSVKWFEWLSKVLDNTKYNVLTKFNYDFSYKAPNVKERNITIDLSKKWNLEIINQSIKEWVNKIHLTIDLWKKSNREYTTTNHILITLMKSLDQKTKQRLFSDIFRNRDIAKALEMIQKDFDDWKWFNFLEKHTLWEKILYSYVKNLWIQKQDFSLKLFNELNNYKKEDRDALFKQVEKIN